MKQALILLLVATSLSSYGQFDRKGGIFSFGLGAGYSRHADGYSEADPLLLNDIEDFSGIRVLTMDLKLGISFESVLMAYVTVKYAPPVVSPHRSLYQGFALSYSPMSMNQWFFTGGGGISKANNSTNQLARGGLANLGVGYEFTPGFMAEVNLFFGKLDSTPLQNQLLANEHELFTNFTLSYIFYRRDKPGDN